MKSLKYNVIHPFFGESIYLYYFTRQGTEDTVRYVRYESEDTTLYTYRRRYAKLLGIGSRRYTIICE